MVSKNVGKPTISRRPFPTFYNRRLQAIGARYLKKKDLCDYLQIANNTLDNWIAQGLPVIIVGGCVRFDRPAVDDWLKNRADELNHSR